MFKIDDQKDDSENGDDSKTDGTPYLGQISWTGLVIYNFWS